jgi:deoxyribonucleoside regulator
MGSKNALAQEPERGADRAVGRVARNRMRIAWMYYVEGLTQNEIADRLGIGRVTVVRNINEAIRMREVKIWIEGNIAECTRLEQDLKAKFGFVDAVVVPEPSDKSAISKSIGVATGMYITGQLHDDMVIGVGWGATLYESLQTLSPGRFSGLEVVSLLGGVVEARRYNPGEFAWQFANIVGADSYLMPAPVIVDSPATRKVLIEKCGIGTAFAHAEKMDLALLSVGSMAVQSTSFRFGFLSEEDRASLKAAGAVGELMFNYFDRDGQLIDHPINGRVMSMPIDSLKKVPRRVMASGGKDKHEALLGSIKLVGCNILLTNEETAQALIDAK